MKVSSTTSYTPQYTRDSLTLYHHLASVIGACWQLGSNPYCQYCWSESARSLCSVDQIRPAQPSCSFCCNIKSRFSILKHIFLLQDSPPKVRQLVEPHPYNPESIVKVSGRHIGTHSTETFSLDKRITWFFSPFFLTKTKN